MRIAIIGRTEVLYETALSLRTSGHDIVAVVTARAAPEYLRDEEDFRQLSASLGVPFVCSSRITEQEDLLRGTVADVAVSMNYVGLIPQRVIDIFPLGILNAHGGDLPRYRGNACQAWAIINGEDRVGLCIHKMVGREIDAGPIISRDYMPIDLSTRVGDILRWIGKRVPSMMLDSVAQLEADPGFVLEHQSGDPGDSLRCCPRLPQDGQINWANNSEDVLRLINASSEPFQGAFCLLDGRRFVIWRAELVMDSESFCAIAGQVVSVGEAHVDVACDRGKIRIQFAQMDSEVAQPTKWIKSIRQRLT